jgi:molecular chaperone DnaK
LVALGAAIQAGVLSGTVKDVLFLDVAPLTLGIETVDGHLSSRPTGGAVTPIIRRNTTLPTRQSRLLSTAEDDQTSVEIHVVQGEQRQAAEATSLARFTLDGIPPAPRGSAQIEVTFDLDADSRLHVLARETATGRAEGVVVQPSSGLSAAEVARLTREAARAAAADRQRRRLIAWRDDAERVLHLATQRLAEDTALDADHRAGLERRLATLQAALAGSELGPLREAVAGMTGALGEAIEGPG